MWLQYLAGNKHQGCQIHIYFPCTKAWEELNWFPKTFEFPLHLCQTAIRNGRERKQLPEDHTASHQPNFERSWMTSTLQPPTREARSRLSPSSSHTSKRLGYTKSTYTSWSCQLNTRRGKYRNQNRHCKGSLETQVKASCFGLTHLTFNIFQWEFFWLVFSRERADNESEIKGLDPEAAGWEAFRFTS